MKKVLITCDCCKQTLGEADSQHFPLTLTFNGLSRFCDRDWCRDCCVKYGLLEPYTTKDKQIEKIEPPPTIEDIIREIIREELEQ